MQNMFCTKFNMIRSSVAGTIAELRLALSAKLHGAKIEGPMIAVVALALLCVAMPFELSQLIFMVIGAAAYALLQSLQSSSKHAPGANGRDSKGTAAVGRCTAPVGRYAPGPKAKAGSAAHCRQALAQKQPCDSRLAPKSELRMPSSMPVGAPSFSSAGWEAEVRELLFQITPTPESDQIVQQLAQLVKQTIMRTIPEIEVVGFASGDLARGKAFGVAVPDVDIVISVSPNVLVGRLQGRLAQGRTTVTNLDLRRLQKSAIRVCTDKLVTQGGFKFRRSAFRGQEPKVTLLAPASLGIFDEAVPVDFTVNSVTPLYNAALLTECGQMDPRAKALILLVKRWSKDRGVCHAAKGHLPPYLWSLLTIYYLQVGVPDEGPILPPLEDFEISSGLMAGTAPAEAKAGALAARSKWAPPADHGSKRPIGELLKGFMRFYSEHFDWRSEAVCVRLGRRAPPELRLPLHIILHEDRTTTELGPSIEDPFDVTSNLGTCMTAASILRLHEELRRADELCSQGASLSQLLEPWIPPEHEAPEDGRDDPEEGTALPASEAPTAA
mmetsp:Transcript_97150/g.313730  ORF Transcript_97150/g.313730 Transcript_97150/m.313730 type:complete len:554 (+) Transcript_97150:93-1754(+)